MYILSDPLNSYIHTLKYIYISYIIIIIYISFTVFLFTNFIILDIIYYILAL